MTGSFNILGIAADADERTIKLAYAKLLKLTRPDDDPEGFQRLNQAYRAALASSKARHAAPPRRPGSAWQRSIPVHLNLSADNAHAHPPAAQDTVARPSAHPRTLRVEPLDPPTEPPRPRVPAFDPAAFIAEFRQRCADGNPTAMACWLSQYPPFWNLPTKHAAGRLLLRALYDQPEHMSEACFAATSDFFHFADTLSGIDPLLLQRVRERGTIAWLVRNEYHAELARRIYGYNTPAGVRHVGAAVRHASGPRRLWRDLLLALPPGRAPRHAALLLRMCNGIPADLPPPIELEHARFWIEAGGPTFGKAKLAAYLARTIAAAILIPASIALFTAIVGEAANEPDYLKSATITGGILLAITLAIVAIVWACVGAKWIFSTLDALGARSRGVRIALFSSTPAWCCIALLIAALVDPALGLLTATVSLITAFLRSRSGARTRRAARGGGFAALAGFGLVLVLMHGIVFAMARLTADTGAARIIPTLALVAVTLGIWAWDWRKRGFLTPRQQPAR